MKVFQRETQLRTTGGLTVRDITEEVAEAVQESGVSDGIACVYSPHTTCCVRVNEFEGGFLEDFAELLRRLIDGQRVETLHVELGTRLVVRDSTAPVKA